MNKFLTSCFTLSFIAHAAQVYAQPDPRKTLDVLYERGQQEMVSNWSRLGITHKSAVFMHNDVRKAANEQLAVWTHNELPVTEYLEKERAYLSMRERMLVDCKTARIGVSDQAYYADHFARGAVVGTNRIRNVEMQEAVPDSIEELLVKTVCAPKPRKAAVKKAKAPAKAAEPAAEKAPEKTTAKSPAKPTPSVPSKTPANVPVNAAAKTGS